MIEKEIITTNYAITVLQDSFNMISNLSIKMQEQNDKKGIMQKKTGSDQIWQKPDQITDPEQEINQ
ncbi:hypothetical protein [Daejeonella sp. H1SJ63]|jgi:hypothetical protein|uniref:hypothetical protein n=1 Tax=Daejeonella sp. H1SJ63 TaxID=3034145 RepID=UPI0023EADB08|nr:hypothetical protein [Daejeonella sp. H1SJ63]